MQDTKAGHISTEICTDDNELMLFTWEEREEWDDARRGTMYCFKNCEANKN